MNTAHHRPNIRHRLRTAATLLIALWTIGGFTSCIDEKEFADNPRGNFEALWKIMDEHYCFFAMKQEQLGVDWDEVHTRYSRQIDDGMTTAQLFEVLCRMIGELRDGHVNLSTGFNYGRNWSWKEDYPANFSDTLQRRYLGTDYRISSGLQYRILADNIGYIYCGSFADGFGEGNLSDIFYYLLPCNAIIVDVRNNSGGQLTAAEQLAARFFDQTTLVGYMQHKNGKGHNDFSSMQKQQIKPTRELRWHKRVAVLTNRATFSAANEFVKYMRCSPLVITVGDRTGGGAGMPFTSELPNGWGVRFSACPMYDREKNSTEQGIAPDHRADISDEDFARGKDTIIELARQLLKE